jgi:hypothetical protein
LRRLTSYQRPAPTTSSRRRVVGLETPWSELGAALDALRDRRVAGKAVLRVE